MCFNRSKRVKLHKMIYFRQSQCIEGMTMLITWIQMSFHSIPFNELGPCQTSYKELQLYNISFSVKDRNVWRELITDALNNDDMSSAPLRYQWGNGEMCTANFNEHLVDPLRKIANFPQNMQKSSIKFKFTDDIVWTRVTVGDIYRSFLQNSFHVVLLLKGRILQNDVFGVIQHYIYVIHVMLFEKFASSEKDTIIQCICSYEKSSSIVKWCFELTTGDWATYFTSLILVIDDLNKLNVGKHFQREIISSSCIETKISFIEPIMFLFFGHIEHNFLDVLAPVVAITSHMLEF